MSAVLAETSFHPILDHALEVARAAAWQIIDALGAFLWWSARGTRSAPRGQLALGLGFLAFGVLPVWILPAPTLDLEYGRLAYLPTVGLAWLLGTGCARARSDARATRAIPVVALGVLVAVSLCGTLPWLRAHDTATAVLTQAARVAETLPAALPQVTLYVEDLPSAATGAQIFANGFAAALDARLPRRFHLIESPHRRVVRGGMQHLRL